MDDGQGQLPALPDGVRVVPAGGVGPAAARNLGAELARGEVLAFTDDDCVASPGWVRELDAAARRVTRGGRGGGDRQRLSG